MWTLETNTGYGWQILLIAVTHVFHEESDMYVSFAQCTLAAVHRKLLHCLPLYTLMSNQDHLTGEISFAVHWGNMVPEDYPFY